MNRQPKAPGRAIKVLACILSQPSDGTGAERTTLGTREPPTTRAERWRNNRRKNQERARRFRAVVGFALRLAHGRQAV